MPQFAPGESKTAIAPITVKPAGLSCEAEIFLGPDEVTKVATSGMVAFTSTGASQEVRLPIFMPATGGTFHVYIDVYAEGYLIAAYQATEDVVVITELIDPNLSFGYGKWDSGGPIPEDYLGNSQHSYIIGHIGAASGSYRFDVLLGNTLLGSWSRSFTGEGISNVAIDGSLPSPGTYIALMNAYRGGVLTGVYYLGTLNVLPIVTPSTFSYKNLTIQTPVLPGAPAWRYWDISCDIVNEGSTTQTRKLAVWRHEYIPYYGLSEGWYCHRGETPRPDVYPGAKDAGGIELTLAPGQVYHYRFCGGMVGSGYTWKIELRDDGGGKSAQLTISR